METNYENQNLELLITKLKKEDSHYASIIKAVQIIYWIFIPLFAVLTSREYLKEKDQNELIGGIFYISAFLIIALFFRKYYKEYKFVDYSLPTVQMLRKAVWRYQLFQKRTIWIYAGLIIMDLALTFDWLNEFPVWVTQAIFLGSITFGYIIGLIIWYKKYKPLRDGALSLIRQIEE